MHIGVATPFLTSRGSPCALGLMDDVSEVFGVRERLGHGSTWGVGARHFAIWDQTVCLLNIFVIPKISSKVRTICFLDP